jgi:glucose dehydrogenase
MTNPTPPRVFGGLLSLFGLALLSGGLHIGINLNADGTYFVIIGVLLAISGVTVFIGKSYALYVYGMTLLTIWIWSYVECGGRFDALMPRVVFPTVIAFYMYSAKIRSRLA